MKYLYTLPHSIYSSNRHFYPYDTENKTEINERIFKFYYILFTFTKKKISNNFLQSAGWFMFQTEMYVSHFKYFSFQLFDFTYCFVGCIFTYFSVCFEKFTYQYCIYIFQTTLSQLFLNYLYRVTF